MDYETVTMVELKDAAEELGTTVLRLLMMRKGGELAAQERDGGWFITREEVDRLKRDGVSPLEQRTCPASCSATGCGRH